MGRSARPFDALSLWMVGGCLGKFGENVGFGSATIFDTTNPVAGKSRFNNNIFGVEYADFSRTYIVWA